jgi:Flp pilus assembly protein TadG
MRLLKRQRHNSNRSGAALAETAVVLPVFFILLFGFIEFGHVFMTIHTLNSAARRAARLGIREASSTADVTALANSIVASAMPVSHVSVIVKDASIFDTDGVNVASLDYNTLADIELSGAARRQLFTVRVSVDYADIAILGPRWLGHLQVYGQAVMRRE